jgi:hypothetical protein
MHPEPPWIVRRDELHVLEEAFDELCRRRADGEPDEAEEAVLREHADTEDKTEAELTAAIGDGWMDAPEGCGHDHEHDPPAPGEGNLLEALRRDLTRDPAYERAIAWAGDAFRWAREQERAARHHELLRVALNACLVPMKMSYAQGELSADDDPYASAVAEKELELASVYLSRARGSLEALEKLGVLTGEHRDLLERTEAIATDIREAKQRLGGTGFRPFGPPV